MPTNSKFPRKIFAAIILLQAFLFAGCSSGGFHLRNNIDLPAIYQKIQLQNIPLNSGFAEAFERALEGQGGELSQSATTRVSINNLREGKRVVAYTKERKARIYLVFLKLEYLIKTGGKQDKQRINLDRTFIYDANFALGKAEEEKQIREGLYAEAARLILLRLQYSNGKESR